MSGRLQGKRAVITGGSRGLGLAIAKAYAEEGAAVAIASRDPNSVTEAVRTLQSKGGEVIGVNCDVGQQEQILNLARQVVDVWGEFDIWINNAGISPAYGPTWQIPIDRITQTIQTNILGVAYGSWIAMHHFDQKGAGVLINLLGRGANRSSPQQNIYGSSKRWVRAFTKTLVDEIENPDIRVIAFNPGLVYTDLVEHVSTVPGSKDRLAVFSRVLALLGNPPEVPARRVVWLATDEGRKAGSEDRLMSTPILFARALIRGAAMLIGKMESDHEVSIDLLPPARSPLTPASEEEGN